MRSMSELNLELNTALDLLQAKENHVEELLDRIKDLEADLLLARLNTENKQRYINLLIETFSNLCSKPVIDHFNNKCKELDERGVYKNGALF